MAAKMKLRRKEYRGPGQPRIDASAPLAHRSVGLPESWWREIDRMARRRGIKTAALVRAAIGVYLKRLRKIEDNIRPICKTQQ